MDRLLDDSIEMPAIGDSLELVLTGILERETAAGREVFYGGARQYLRGARDGPDTRPDHDGDAARFPVDRLDLSGVDPSAHLDPQRLTV